MTPIDPKRIEILNPKRVAYWRSQTPAQKLEKSWQARRTVRGVLRFLIQDAHADWGDSQIAAEVARRVLRGSDWIDNNIDRFA